MQAVRPVLPPTHVLHESINAVPPHTPLQSCVHAVSPVLPPTHVLHESINAVPPHTPLQS
ncbi:MAG: hypothetical protein H6535_03565 [Bacteroidia bacterium]|nr:hypothetical protein [Bacteroidia bacterium]